MLSHINVGTGTDVTIGELTETIKQVVEFDGGLVFDQTNPDGQLSLVSVGQEIVRIDQRYFRPVAVGSFFGVEI